MAGDTTVSRLFLVHEDQKTVTDEADPGDRQHQACEERSQRVELRIRGTSHDTHASTILAEASNGFLGLAVPWVTPETGAEWRSLS